MATPVITAQDITEVPDNGGVKITFTGTFTVDMAHTITTSHASDPATIYGPCYSGVVGNAADVISLDGTSLSFISPPMPPVIDGFGGPSSYDIHVLPDVGSNLDVKGNLDVIHRTFASTLFGLRSNAARPRYVGPYSIDDED